MNGAPKPPNFAAMSDAWNHPEEFAAAVNAYYVILGAQHATEARDITEPTRGGEE